MTRGVLGTLAVLAAVGTFYPASYDVCPTWEVVVVDTSGQPLSDMTVRRSCNDYSVGKSSESDRTTDARGKVSFDAEQVRVPAIAKWLGNVFNAVTQGVHAGYGRHSSVFTFGRGLEGSPVRDGYIEFWTGSPDHMESRIVAKPVLLK